MGLASALSTALTGLTAAETTIDVIGNNLANANTVGFKSSQATFATQFLQTRSLGSGPTNNSGGTNPRQIGLGTMVADITPNFSQGTIQISSNPTDLAIQGDGFFIVEGTSGERLYTRNGIFKLNSQNQLVTITGNRLLGFGVDDQYEIQTTNLVPITIPLGAAAVAKATSTVYLQGTLTPTGAIADRAANIQTGILGDGQWSSPVSAVDVEAAAAADRTGLTPTPYTGTGSVDAGTYWYKIVYADGAYGAENATEGTASTGFQVTVAGGDNTVRFDNMLANEHYSHIRVYRTAKGGSVNDPYYYVGEAEMKNIALSGASGQGIDDPAGAMTPGTYFYRLVYATAPNPSGDTGPATTARTALGITLSSSQDAVQLADLPTQAGYQYVRIYRSQRQTNASVNPETLAYYYAGEVDTSVTTSFKDTAADSSLGAALVRYVPFEDTTSNAEAITRTRLDTTSTLDGQYRYYVTFYSTANGRESRPNEVSNVITVQPGRIHLYDLPTPPTGDTAEWDQIRIYRNLRNDSDSFYLVTTIDYATTRQTSYTDCVSDATLVANNRPLDRDGPKITESTLLKDITRREGSTYGRVFDYPAGGTATLQFTGRKGGRSLATKEFTITDSTTVLELITFMEDALGIQKRPGPDPSRPIPIDANSGRAPGGLVQNGRIVLVGNNGEDNAIQIGLSGMQLVTTTGQTTVNMPFSTLYEAAGESAATDFIVYDSLGIPLAVRLTAVLESRTSTNTVYRWFADSPDNDPTRGVKIAVGTGLLYFDGEGNFITASSDTVSISREHISSASPLEFTLDFRQLSGLAAAHSTLAVSRQDGSSPGVLTSFIVGEDGRIRGVFSNGITRDLGQIRLVRFANPTGLEQRGENMFSSGVNSGLPIEGNPNEQGIGSIIAGAQELSNTDIGGNLVDLILASTMYRGNTRVVTTIQQMLDELLSLRR